MKHIFALLFILFYSSAYSYTLVIVQGVSRENQTFITRTGKADGIVVGKEGTFTTEDISFIAKAVSVSREFTQWEIKNQFTDVPFKRGDIITYYDTSEYLWALSPSEVAAKYIKTQKYYERKSLAFNSYFTRAYNEAVSGVDETKVIRGAIQAELSYEQEITKTYAWSLGGRFTRENIQGSDATLVNDRVLGIGEFRYYLDPMVDFYYSRFSFSIGAGYGQSQTTTTGVVSSGSARVLPILKVGLHIPINLKTVLMLEGGIESVNIKEQYEDGTEQITNLNHGKIGIGIRRYLNL